MVVGRKGVTEGKGKGGEGEGASGGGKEERGKERKGEEEETGLLGMRGNGGG